MMFKVGSIAAGKRQAYSFLTYLDSLHLQEGQVVAFAASASLKSVGLLYALWQRKLIALPLNPKWPALAQQNAISASGALFIDLDQASLLSPTIEEFAWQEDRLCTMVATSGSTGEPKFVCHTLKNHLASAKAAASALQLGLNDRYYLSLPLYHVSGLAILFRCLVSGANLFSAEEGSIKDATHLSLVPTQLYRAEMDELRHLKCILLGGAATAETLLKKALANDLKIFTCYGMSETSSFITLNPLYLTKEFHLGRPVDCANIRIADDGEILVKAESLFQGYWDKEQKKPILTVRDGWFATRDLGRLNEKGELFFMGRKDRMLISGGENIYPEQVEEALMRLEGVQQALVTGVFDAEFGMRLQAFIYCVEKTWSFQELTCALQTQLPKYMCPKKLHYLPRLYEKHELQKFRVHQEDLLKSPE